MRVIGLIVAGALTGGLVLTANAQQEPEAKGAVAVRQNTMKAMGGHSGAIQKILTEQPDLASQVPVHAEAIAGIARIIPAMFPDGTDQAPTAALPPVWNDRAGFQAAADKALQLAGRLSETAKGGDQRATLAAFAQLGKEGCGGCHETYRKKQN
jgi:cytochrome c556